MEIESENRGHRGRLREKFRRTGHDAMFDYEKIELLLTYAIPRRDVKPLAKELLKQFGGIAGLFEASREELEAVPGIGENLSTLILLMRGLCADAFREKIRNRDCLSCSADVIRYARAELAGLRREVFLVIYVNTRNEVLDSEILAQGTIDQLFVHPRELLGSALRRNARGVILVHNHPGGTASPSGDDIRLTDSIRKIGESMRIDVLDHIIITHNSAYSIDLKTSFDLGTEESLRFAAEKGGKKDYSVLPFHPARLKSLRTKSMIELTGKRQEEEEEEKDSK